MLLCIFVFTAVLGTEATQGGDLVSDISLVNQIQDRLVALERRLDKSEKHAQSERNRMLDQINLLTENCRDITTIAGK